MDQLICHRSKLSLPISFKRDFFGESKMDLIHKIMFHLAKALGMIVEVDESDDV
jgi:hypothetical protein